MQSWVAPRALHCLWPDGGCSRLRQPAHNSFDERGERCVRAERGMLLHCPEPGQHSSILAAREFTDGCQDERPYHFVFTLSGVSRGSAPGRSGTAWLAYVVTPAGPIQRGALHFSTKSILWPCPPNSSRVSRPIRSSTGTSRCKERVS